MSAPSSGAVAASSVAGDHEVERAQERVERAALVRVVGLRGVALGDRVRARELLGAAALGRVRGLGRGRGRAQAQHHAAAPRTRSTSTCGSRRVRPRRAARLTSSIARGSDSGRRRPVADERLVDAAEPAAVGRVDRRAERDRLAVHRPAGRDDEVDERDEALAVDRALGDDERRAGRATAGTPLLLGPREHGGLHARVASKHLRTEPSTRRGIYVDC